MVDDLFVWVLARRTYKQKIEQLLFKTNTIFFLHLTKKTEIKCLYLLPQHVNKLFKDKKYQYGQIDLMQ